MLLTTLNVAFIGNNSFIFSPDIFIKCTSSSFQSNEEILRFAQDNYNVNFPMFAKIDVMNNNQHPVYKFLEGILLLRASEVGSPKNCLGSGPRRDMDQ